MIVEKLLKLEEEAENIAKEFKEVNRRERLIKTREILEALSNLYKGHENNAIQDLLNAVKMDIDPLENNITIRLDDTILHRTNTITPSTLLGILREHETELLDYIHDTVKWLHDKGVQELDKILKKERLLEQKLAVLTEDMNV